MHGLKVPSYVIESNARTTTYFADMTERFDGIRYGELTTQNSKYTIKLILERIHPAALKASVEGSVQVEPRLKTDVSMFIQRFKDDPGACQASGQQLETGNVR